MRDIEPSANNLVPLLKVQNSVQNPYMSRVDILAPILDANSGIESFLLDLHYSINRQCRRASKEIISQTEALLNSIRNHEARIILELQQRVPYWPANEVLNAWKQGFRIILDFAIANKEIVWIREE